MSLRNLLKAAAAICSVSVVVAANEANEARELSSSTSNWQLHTVAGAYGMPNFLGTSASLVNAMGTSGVFSYPIAVALIPKVDVSSSDAMAVLDIEYSGSCGYSEFYELSSGGLTSSFYHHATQIAFLPNGDPIYTSQEGSNVMRITSGPDSAWFAGTWDGYGYSGDGFAATSARLYRPQGLAVDSMGNVFIADSGNKVIRKVDTNGIITTYAGQFYYDSYNYGDRRRSLLAPSSGYEPTMRYSGDGGAAALAHLGFPTGVACDMMGNLYIADNDANVIRMVNMEGIISTIAGVPNALGYNGDGPATLALIEAPYAITVDPMGNIYFSNAAAGPCFDTLAFGVHSGYMIRRIDAKTGMLTTVAGMPTNGKDIDFQQNPSWFSAYVENYPDVPSMGVPGTSIALNSVTSLAFDSMGNLLFTEPVASVVRMLVPMVPTSMPTKSPSKTQKPTMKMSQRPTMKKSPKPTMKRVALAEETAQKA